MFNPEGQAKSFIWTKAELELCGSIVELVKFDFFKYFVTTSQFNMCEFRPDLLSRLIIITNNREILIFYNGVIFKIQNRPIVHVGVSGY